MGKAKGRGMSEYKIGDKVTTDRLGVKELDDNIYPVLAVITEIRGRDRYFIVHENGGMEVEGKDIKPVIEIKPPKDAKGGECLHELESISCGDGTRTCKKCGEIISIKLKAIKGGGD